MLKNNEVMAVPSLGQLTLYNDNMHKADSDEYRVDYVPCLTSILPESSI